MKLESSRPQKFNRFAVTGKIHPSQTRMAKGAPMVQNIRRMPRHKAV